MLEEGEKKKENSMNVITFFVVLTYLSPEKVCDCREHLWHVRGENKIKAE